MDQESHTKSLSLNSDRIRGIVEFVKSLLSPQGFRPEAKSRGGTLVTLAYIKESTYSSNIQSVY